MRLSAALMVPAYRNVEGALGPFYEPARPRPLLTDAERGERAARLESLLERLARARAYTLLIPGVFGLVGAVIALLQSAAGGTRAASLAEPAILFAIGLGLYFRQWSYWAIHGVFGLRSLFGIPTPFELTEASRDFYDAVVALEHPERTAFLQSLSAGGFSFVAIAVHHSWSLVPSGDKTAAA